MPLPDELPDTLKALSQLQRRELRDGDTWETDLGLLIQRVASELGRPTRSRKRLVLTIAGICAVLGIVAISWSSFVNPFRKLQPNLTAQPIVLFETGNDIVVQQGPSGPPQPAVFTSTKVHYISHVYTYHWNNGKGSPPGRVSLRRADGTLYGPWEVSAFAGESNAPNVNWVAEPRIVVPTATYTVQDSEPKTWSYNATSGYRGFTIVKVLPME